MTAAAGAALAAAGGAVLRRLRMSDLRGQTVLITGGSRGLGLQLAREFARQGCKIAICGRDEKALESARVDLEQTGTRVIAVPCDVGERERVENMVRQVTARFGRVDLLVNNAGIIQVGPLSSMTCTDFEEALRVMFWGELYPTLAVLPQMLERRAGTIVNITSIGGKVSVPHLVPYNCAKFAAVAFSEGLNAELRPYGVRVVTVVPGLMRTGSYLNAFFKGDKESEYRWFGLSANLPVLSISGERAARRIVRAARRGEAECTLTAPAKLLARFHGLFPGLTATLLAWVNRLVLPRGADTAKTKGLDVEHGVRSRAWKVATGLGRAAADRMQHLPKAA